MLEEDYLALNKHADIGYVPHKTGVHNIGSQIVREIVLPELEKEVNTGKNFAPLRQIFNSLILANWYKDNLKKSLLSQVYADKNTVNGVALNDPSLKERIYQQYLKAYKKGVFNYIKEESQPDGQIVPKKYFSGGIKVENTEAQHPLRVTDLSIAQRVNPFFARGTGIWATLLVALVLNNPFYQFDAKAVNTVIPSIQHVANQVMNDHAMTVTPESSIDELELNLTEKVIEILKKSGILLVGQLRNKKAKELLKKFPSFGVGIVNEIRRGLKTHGFYFEGENPFLDVHEVSVNNFLVRPISVSKTEEMISKEILADSPFKLRAVVKTVSGTPKTVWSLLRPASLGEESRWKIMAQVEFNGNNIGEKENEVPSKSIAEALLAMDLKMSGQTLPVGWKIEYKNLMSSELMTKDRHIVYVGEQNELGFPIIVSSDEKEWDATFSAEVYQELESQFRLFKRKEDSKVYFDPLNGQLPKPMGEGEVHQIFNNTGTVIGSFINTGYSYSFSPKLSRRGLTFKFAKPMITSETGVDILELSTRVEHSLSGWKLQELVGYSADELKELIRLVGDKGLAELQLKLRRFGLHLREGKVNTPAIGAKTQQNTVRVIDTKLPLFFIVFDPKKALDDTLNIVKDGLTIGQIRLEKLAEEHLAILHSTSGIKMREVGAIKSEIKINLLNGHKVELINSSGEWIGTIGTRWDDAQDLWFLTKDKDIVLKEKPEAANISNKILVQQHHEFNIDHDPINDLNVFLSIKRGENTVARFQIFKDEPGHRYYIDFLNGKNSIIIPPRRGRLFIKDQKGKTIGHINTKEKGEFWFAGLYGNSDLVLELDNAMQAESSEPTTPNPRSRKTINGGKNRASKAQIVSATRQSVGGIDLSTADSGITLTKDTNGGVKVNFDPVMIARIRQKGVQSAVPVIIDVHMMSVEDIKPLLGERGQGKGDGPL